MDSENGVAPSTSRRIAVYRTSSIGDVILATACLDLLDRSHIQADVTWIGRSPSLDLLAASWGTVRFLPAPRSDGFRELAQSAKALAGTDLFVDLQCNLRSRMLGWILSWRHGTTVVRTPKAQARRTGLILAARRRGRDRSLADNAIHPPERQYETMRDTLARGLRLTFITSPHSIPVHMAVPRLGAPVGAPAPAELTEGQWIAVAPGAAHPTKQAPISVMASAINMAAERMKRLGLKQPGLLILGNEHDAETGRELLSLLSWPAPVASMAGRLSLHETGIALSRCSALISNDSALGHLSEAFGTPAGVLFGPTVEGFGFPPRLPDSRAFSSRLGCRPCSKHGKTPCRYDDQLCFHMIPLESVSEWIASRVAESATGKAAP